MCASAAMSSKIVHRARWVVWLPFSPKPYRSVFMSRNASSICLRVR
jgi:hypothetical protein